MAITALTPTFQQSVDGSGAVRDFWIKVKGIIGDATGGLVIHTIENPYFQDLLIKRCILYVSTASGNVATDLDIGLGDDTAGTSNGAEIVDGAVAATLNTTGFKDCGIVHAIATPPVIPIWKAHDNSTDAFICIDQNGSVDASALRATLLINVVPVGDVTS